MSVDSYAFTKFFNNNIFSNSYHSETSKIQKGTGILSISACY